MFILALGRSCCDDYRYRYSFPFAFTAEWSREEYKYFCRSDSPVFQVSELEQVKTMSSDGHRSWLVPFL